EAKANVLNYLKSSKFEQNGRYLTDLKDRLEEIRSQKAPSKIILILSLEILGVLNEAVTEGDLPSSLESTISTLNETQWNAFFEAIANEIIAAGNEWEKVNGKPKPPHEHEILVAQAALVDFFASKNLSPVMERSLSQYKKQLDSTDRIADCLKPFA